MRTEFNCRVHAKIFHSQNIALHMLLFVNETALWLKQDNNTEILVWLLRITGEKSGESESEISLEKVWKCHCFNCKFLEIMAVGKLSTFYITEKNKWNKKRQYEIDLYSIIFRAIRLIKRIKFCKSHDRKSLCVITCNIASSKNIKEFTIPHWILFARCVILSVTAQVTCVFEST